jgi:Putative zincin peptidase
MWTLLDPKVFLATVIPGILAHELIHAIAWSIAARRPLRAIRIGIRWRAVSPYAHPKEPMLVGPYRVGAVMPAVCLGFVPAGLAILLGWPLLMAWSLVFVLAAGGDFVVLWLLRGVPADRLVEDHPTRAGCHVLESELTSSAASLHP